MNDRTDQDPRREFDRLIEGAYSFARENNSDAVLFMGQPTDPIPRVLILDRDLPPVARLLWCYFRQRSDSPGAAGIASDYDTIREEMGIGSRSTVADAIHALRVTRWITLLPQPALAGQYSPKIYLLHNAPLTFSQAIDLDPAYTDRIAEALRSPSKRVRELAQRMLDGAIVSSAPGDSSGNELYRLAGFAQSGAEAIPGLWQHVYGRMPQRAETGTEESPGAVSVEISEGSDLDFHEEIFGLSSLQKKLMKMKIVEVDEEYRQAYLDELAAIVVEREGGSDPIRNPPAYLMKLIELHRTGNIALSGKGERLEELLRQKRQETERRQQAKDDARMGALMGDLSHIRRLIEYCETGGKQPEPWMLADLERVEKQIRLLGRSRNGAS